MDLETLRHSTSHIMAHAVKELYPSALLGIGPAIDDGFYYDFDLDTPLTAADLVKIEKRMADIVSRKLQFERIEMARKEAVTFFNKLGEKYKVELLEEIPDEKVTAYKQGEFIDLCRGPHIESTAKTGAFKLLSVAGAYWRGSEKNKMLQRIYGTAFSSEKELDKHLNMLEEAKKRDHRKIGAELDLFSIQDDIGPGLVLWHPRGAIVRKTIEDYWREAHIKNGYQAVFIPHVARQDLWRTSGHLQFYSDYMYSPMEVEGKNYLIKPMNCPGHILIYKSRMRSYRELPIRYAELGTVYRYERSGVLHGLMRVRGFTQDDAHIFVQPEKLEEEIISVIKFVREVLTTFGFPEYDVYLSTRPEKYVGTLDNWAKAESALKGALEKEGFKYSIDPGEGVFYGPKIDIKIKDCLGRSWQCTTIQVDFNLPERFDVRYVAEDGKEHTPIMIHRALMGSLERFFGVLIEHYAGAFPLWLSPVQAMVIPISENFLDYAESIRKALSDSGVRAEVDSRNEKMQYKIREAQINKIPYMLVVGEREKANGTVSARSRLGGDAGAMALKDFISKIIDEIKLKKG